MKKFIVTIASLAVLPLLQNSAYAADGAAIFKAKCVPCHGYEGKGTAMAPAFKGNAYIGESSVEEISDVIRNGRQGAEKKYRQFAIGMPRQSLNHDESTAVIEYLKILSGHIKSPNANGSPNRKNAITRVESDEKTIAVHNIQLNKDGKDTSYGTVYALNGTPDAENLYIGGWGDFYYDFFEFDLDESPTAEQTISATLYFYGNAPEGGADPEFQVHRITQSWIESGVTYSNNPTSVFYKNFGTFHVGAKPVWNKVDITDLYINWKKGSYPNYGVKLVPTKNNHTNGSIASSNNPNMSIRPKLEIVYMPAHPEGTPEFKNATLKRDEPSNNDGAVKKDAVYIPLMNLIHEDRKMQATGELSLLLYRPAFSYDGKLIARSFGRETHIADVATGNTLKILEGSNYGLVFSSDGKLFGVQGVREKAVVNVWDVTTGNKIKSIKSSSRERPAIAVSPDGRVLAIKTDNYTTLWDVSSWNVLKTLKYDLKMFMREPFVLFSLDGNTLITDGDYNTTVLWDAATGNELKTLPVSFLKAAVSPDGKMLASSEIGQATVRIHDLASGNLLKKLEGSFMAVAYSPDGKVIASAGMENNVILWDVATGNKLKSLDNYTSRRVYDAVFSPDGKKLALYGDHGELTLLDTLGVYLSLSSMTKKNLQLEGERDIKIRELFKPKGEFEAKIEYDERIKFAKIEEVRIRKTYDDLIKEASDKSEKELTEKRSKLYPVTMEAKLGKYDADNKRFEAEILEKRIFISVPRDKATEIAKRKENVVVYGLIKYIDDKKAELLNAFLVDKATEEKFAFGRHTDAAMMASVQNAPPSLKIATLELIEPSDNGILDAGEKGSLKFVVKNEGSGPAFGASLVLQADKSLSGLRLNEKVYIGQISPSEEKIVEVDIAALENIQSAELNVNATIVEASGFDSRPVIISFKTKELVPPLLQIVKVDVQDADGRRVITKGKEAKVTLTVQNAGDGTSRGVLVAAEPVDANIKLFGDSSINIGELPPGAIKKVSFSVAVTARYSGLNELPLRFSIKEERERFSVRPEIKLTLNEEAPELRVVKVEARETAAPRIENSDNIDSPPVLSDEQKIMGDKDIAVVIGIERYRRLTKAEYSYNDARAVKAYLKSLGFAERNIKFLADEEATLSAINSSIASWLPNRVKKESRVFVYYSGHGSPDPVSGEAYLIPHDGDPNYLKDTGYPLKKLYESLGRLEATEVALVMDACFSGSGGRSVLAKGARPAVFAIEDPVLASKNIAVLSSTQGAQISTSFAEKEHGLFTYYFLKAIKDGKKDLAEIYEYIRPLVEDSAREQNVEQSPTLRPGPEVVRDRFGLKR